MFRAYLDVESDSHSPLLLHPQDAADLLDELLAGDAASLNSVEIVEVVRWLTHREDPMGRTSWQRLIQQVIDQACTRKGLVAIECDMALPWLAQHPVAADAFAQHTQALSMETGHPRAFVPLIAQQAPGAIVDPSALAREVCSPQNRWLIRENLNLADAKLRDPGIPWTDALRRKVESAARDWLWDSSSEHEVRRAAARVMKTCGLPETDYPGRLRLADDVQALRSTRIDPHVSVDIEREARAVTQLLARRASAELSESDDVLVGLLRSAIYGRSDSVRRQATRWLFHSAYKPALAEQARIVVKRTKPIELDSGRLRSWIRLLGKVGDSAADARILWSVVQAHEVASATLETALWALCDLSATIGPTGEVPDWSMLAGRLPGRTRGTTQRAIVSILGRSGNLHAMRNLIALEEDAEREKRWWLSR